MFDLIGPNTWALLIGLIFVAIGGFLTSRGTVALVVGAVIFSVAVGVVVGIFFPSGTEVPGTTLPVGYAATLLAAAATGLSVLARANDASSSGRNSNWRERVPQLNTPSFALALIGVLLLIVPFSVLLSNFDFDSGKSGKGFEIFSANFDRDQTRFLNGVENFLAK